jgi:hypothetical protein
MKIYLKTVAVIATAFSPLLLAPEAHSQTLSPWGIASIDSFTVQWRVPGINYTPRNPVYVDKVVASGHGDWDTYGTLPLYTCNAFLSRGTSSTGSILDYLTPEVGFNWASVSTQTAMLLENANFNITHYPWPDGYKFTVSVGPQYENAVHSVTQIKTRPIPQ